MCKYINCQYLCTQIYKNVLPYIGKFSRQEILANMMLGGCIKFLLSLIFAITRTLNEDVLQGLFLAVSIFGDFREVTNSAIIKPTRKIPDIRYLGVYFLSCLFVYNCIMSQTHLVLNIYILDECYLCFVYKLTEI